MSKSALIADNDFYLTAFIAEELESAGYDVLKAYNGLEALALLEQHEIDLLVVDLIMPVVNGRQLIRFLRDKSPKIRFPIVALFIVEEGEEVDGYRCGLFRGQGPCRWHERRHLSSVLDMVEKGPPLSPSNPEIFQNPRLIPRHTNDELLQSLNYTEGIIENLAMRDTGPRPKDKGHFKQSRGPSTGSKALRRSPGPTGEIPLFKRRRTRGSWKPSGVSFRNPTPKEE